MLKRQDGEVLDDLLEPKFNTFVVVVDGLRPEDVTPVLMPNLTGLVGAECTEPGDDCATSYEQARSIMVSETNSNHVAMMTGAYAADTGIIANETLNRVTDEAIDTDRPALNFAETIFDSIESEKPWLKTALVMGKTKLRDLFDCTRTAGGDCGPSDDNPEGTTVNHLRADIVGGALEPSPDFDPDLDCPAEPGTGSGYATNECVMDKTLKILNEEDPDFSFVNAPEVDAFSHASGAGSPVALAKVVDADEQIGRLVDRVKESGRWQHSTVIVTADHNFGDTINPANTIIAEDEFDGAGPSPFTVVTHGGSASVFLPDLVATETPDANEQATLAELRLRALAIDGIEEALYRLPNPADGGSAFTLDTVHPDWNLGGTDRMGELLIVADEQHSIVETIDQDENVILGEHGHATDRHIPFVVASGGPYLVDQTVAPSVPEAVDQRDDTGILTEQAENVDIAPTIAWLLGVHTPAEGEGRVLSEAFSEHPATAQADGDITEPIANRAAIFIYDANNSVELHCLIDSTTCGDPIPEEATDPDFVPTLTDMAEDGTFTKYGSVATWPSVTFPNHNVVGSGAYPGHHGIVNNRFYIREEKKFEEPINSSSTEHPLFTFSSALLSPDIETLHEAVHRTYGDWTEPDGPGSDKAYTASVNEPSSRGADYATLEPDQSFPNPASYIATENPSELAADTTQSCAEANDGYLTESTLDHIGQTQARRVYEDTAQHPLPKYLINNFTLTDGAGHTFGPHTECTRAAYHDADRRLARIVGAMKDAGVYGETLIVVTGDHGMENQNLDRRGLPSDFETQLNEAGIDHVMADWQVYLLTVDVQSSTTNFTESQPESSTFTVTDDDTGEPVEGALVTIQGATTDVSGTTDADGKITLNFTPDGSALSAIVTHDEFNNRFLPLPLTCPNAEALPGNHIRGTDASNVLEGTPGPDVICAMGGNDFITGAGGDDIVLPGRGHDQVSGGPGAHVLKISLGDDTMRGNGGPDRIAGGANVDDLFGGNGTDMLFGRPGDDELFGGGADDTLFGGKGDDALNGGPGNDGCRGGPGKNSKQHCEPS
ncbi:MAG TPA: alkaline phosphatase family protein [Actinomycetota bacterium]|nr:alkaline phosphatase family protein [Actinomycetota bacterium]